MSSLKTLLIFVKNILKAFLGTFVPQKVFEKNVKELKLGKLGHWLNIFQKGTKKKRFGKKLWTL